MNAKTAKLLSRAAPFFVRPGWSKDRAKIHLKKVWYGMTRRQRGKFRAQLKEVCRGA